MLGSSSSTALHEQNLPHPQIANLQLLLACAAAGSLQSALWQARRTSNLSGDLTTPAASAFCSSRGDFSKGALLLAVLVHSVLVLLLERAELLLQVRWRICVAFVTERKMRLHTSSDGGSACSALRNGGWCRAGSWRAGEGWLGARCIARYAPEKNQRIKKCITLQDWTLTLHPPKLIKKM